MKRRPVRSSADTIVIGDESPWATSFTATVIGAPIGLGPVAPPDEDPRSPSATSGAVAEGWFASSQATTTSAIAVRATRMGRRMQHLTVKKRLEYSILAAHAQRNCGEWRIARGHLPVGSGSGDRDLPAANRTHRAGSSRPWCA